MPTSRPDPLQPLREALAMWPVPSDLTPHLDAAIRAAVRAVTPGRQQARNLAPLVDQARRAVVRALRRRAAS